MKAPERKRSDEDKSRLDVGCISDSSIARDAVTGASVLMKS